MATTTKAKKEEQIKNIRGMISRANHERKYSFNVRSDFFTILMNMGGVMTLKQAHDTLEMIDGSRIPSLAYRAEKFLYPEIKAHRIAIDHDKQLVYEGQFCDIVYDPYVLWAYSYILKISRTRSEQGFKVLDDILSPVATLGQNRSITCTCDGEYQKIFFTDHASVANLGRQILANEQVLLQMPVNPDLVRPLYIVFVTETDKAAINLTLDRLAELDIKSKHRIVVPVGNWMENDPGFEEYEVAPDEDENTPEN